MSTQSVSSVRIVIDRNGSRYYLGTFVDDPNNKGKHLPQLLTADHVRQSWLGSRDRAVQLVKVLREQSWDAHLIDPGTGSLLYEEAIQRFGAPTTPTSEDREPWQCGGALIVPASLGRWTIRFPRTSFESIYAATPQEAWDKLQARPDLIPYAEKYIEHATDIAPAIQTPHAAPQHSARRVRPGSL
jgi:hypothetical protein